jgi:hypothetical protein
MRHPFFNMTQLVLRPGESDFHLLDGREGLIVTLGPEAGFYDRPGSSVSRWPGVKTLAMQTPHPAPKRSLLAGEAAFLMRLLFGGGDVKFNLVKTLARQREVLVSAGDGNVAEKIDLADLARQGAPPLHFLQPAFLCASAHAIIRSVLCSAAMASWARAPFVYRAETPQDLSRPTLLVLSARTLVWQERLEPGESRDFALGAVVAATQNIDATLRPTSQCHPDDYRAEIVAAAPPAARGDWRVRLKGVLAPVKIMFHSVRAREGFFVCELANRSEAPAFVFIQLNRSSFYGGSGLVGWGIRLVAALSRSAHVTLH